MNRIKRHPMFWATLLLLAALLVTEIWLLQREHRRARLAVAKLERTRQESVQLARQPTALTEENEQAIGRDLASAEATLAVWQACLLGHDPQQLAAVQPENSIDAYFDITAFVERTHALAALAQVVLKPDERFGFATYANEGPAPELVPAVFRQRLMLQYLVEQLIKARPLAVLAVQREQPMNGAQRFRRGNPAHSGSREMEQYRQSDQAGDFFDFDKDISLRVPGLADSAAFRLEFSGQTRAVRTFLNALATFKLPVVVRSVEVEPLSSTTPVHDSSSPPAPGAMVPLVAQNLSRFCVVMEFIEPVAASGKPAS